MPPFPTCALLLLLLRVSLCIACGAFILGEKNPLYEMCSVNALIFFQPRNIVARRLILGLLLNKDVCTLTQAQVAEEKEVL